MSNETSKLCQIFEATVQEESILSGQKQTYRGVSTTYLNTKNVDGSTIKFTDATKFLGK